MNASHVRVACGSEIEGRAGVPGDCLSFPFDQAGFESGPQRFLEEVATMFDPAPYVAPDGRTEAQLIAAHVLPDAGHPGVVNPNVSPANVKVTICKDGWTATVRPPTDYTDKLRAQLTPAGHKPLEGELDHRLSIEDGGHPSDPGNLWWMVYKDRYGARVKDVLETNLKKRVCSGGLSLDQARAVLMGNWLVAYQTYVGPLPK